MNRRPTQVALTAALLIASTLTLAAQNDRRLPTPPGNARAPERRLALVVGNNAYLAAPLRNAVADARAVGGVLRELGFDVAELLDADLPAFERAVASLVAKVTPADAVVVFYAGHGVQVDGQNYLVPVGLTDTDEAALRHKAYPAELLREKLAKARVQVLVFDACRDNPFRATRSAAAGLASMQALGALVAFATAPGQTASDNPGGTNGLFTTHFLEALKEPGQTARDVFYRVRQRVYETSAGKQVPWLSDGLLGDFVFRPVAASAPSTTLTVRTDPPGATVFVDGRVRGVAAPDLVVTGLGAGRHDVLARKDGFAEARLSIELGAAPATTSLSLAATSGALRVAAAPPDAEVLVDGVARGRAGAEVTGLAPGLHRVEVTRTGHVPFYGDVEIRAGETRALNLTLERMSARGADDAGGILRVTSAPDGATVYLDGTLIGTTPITLESVPAGQRQLRIAKEYHARKDVSVTIEPRVVSRVTEQLSLLPAELVLESDLGAGTLFVDGREVGALQPAQSLPLQAGRHAIRIVHPEAGDLEREVALAGGTQRVSMRRGEYLGALTILSDVELTSLTVAGRTADLPPVTVRNLPAGRVRVAGRASEGVVATEATVTPGDTSVLRLAASMARAAAPLTLRLDAQTALTFVQIEPGVFLMGSENGDADERPAHRVTISRGFELGATEVTQAQWVAVMGSNPSAFTACGGTCPVEQVSWADVQAFLAKLNARRDGYVYRLPTEAEWEYAARAGTTEDHAGNLEGMAWYSVNSGSRTHPVGTKQANWWGLYDMHGNVWEWVADWLGAYPSGAVADPLGPSSGVDRVFRGGSWVSAAGGCRSADRTGGVPGGRNGNLGFRVLRGQSQ